MAGPLSPEAFKELASADCTVELATRAVETLHGMEINRVTYLEGLLSNDTPLTAFNTRFSPVDAEATEDQRVAREVALMRVKGELRTVADSASGKRVPPAKVRTEFLTRSAARFGGSLTNNLLVDSPMLAAILLDPGVYRSLRIPCDQAETQESTETRERLDGESVQVKIRPGSREPRSFSELTFALCGWLVAVEVA
ncbi:hypothetical protein FOL46_002594 [Perkinsus olseni]|uniref:Uncharacterized protein n=1 Tax=Perkinsus olseni TaxID=32597 RepID=A0A7J6KNR9_PEROL|nr:hypothetical protein FOL46_002594 [Perkinsus olseni]